VPIDTRRVEEFDPFGVPTVGELLGEIDAWDEKHKGDGVSEEPEAESKKVADWEKTSLKPYVDFFRGFVAALLKDEKAAGGKREREDGPSAVPAAADPMEF
jgi:DNA primase small subunit